MNSQSFTVSRACVLAPLRVPLDESLSVRALLGACPPTLLYPRAPPCVSSCPSVSCRTLRPLSFSVRVRPRTACPWKPGVASASSGGPPIAAMFLKWREARASGARADGVLLVLRAGAGACVLFASVLEDSSLSALLCAACLSSWPSLLCAAGAFVLAVPCPSFRLPLALSSLSHLSSPCQPFAAPVSGQGCPLLVVLSSFGPSLLLPPHPPHRPFCDPAVSSSTLTPRRVLGASTHHGHPASQRYSRARRQRQRDPP